MDHAAESERARLDQFKRDRLPYVIGHGLATIALITIAWPVADHSALLWFGLAHHIANWVVALTFYFPLRSTQVKQIPLWTYVGVIVVNATLSSALLFDLDAARDLSFTLVVGVVLFSGAAGSFVTLGVHAPIIRIALTSLLLPFVITAFFLGHIAVALGTMFFYFNVVVAGVWKLSMGQQELISLRVDAAHRAEAAEHDAETDPLTGLSNRRGVDRLEGKLLTTGAAALYFDLNKFKIINDTYGHGIGDEILKIVAQRLRSAVSSNDVVARLGGDEFLVLIFGEEAGAVESIERVVERVCKRLNQPASVSGGLVLEISAAVGHSHTNAPVLRLNDLLRDSDEAMYVAKGGDGRTASPDPSVAGQQSKDQANTGLTRLPPLQIDSTTSTLPGVHG